MDNFENKIDEFEREKKTETKDLNNDFEFSGLLELSTSSEQLMTLLDFENKIMELWNNFLKTSKDCLHEKIDKDKKYWLFAIDETIYKIEYDGVIKDINTNNAMLRAFLLRNYTEILNKDFIEMIPNLALIEMAKFNSKNTTKDIYEEMNLAIQGIDDESTVDDQGKFLAISKYFPISENLDMIRDVLSQEEPVLIVRSLSDEDGVEVRETDEEPDDSDEELEKEFKENNASLIFFNEDGFDDNKIEKSENINETKVFDKKSNKEILKLNKRKKLHTYSISLKPKFTNMWFKFEDSAKDRATARQNTITKLLNFFLFLNEKSLETKKITNSIELKSSGKEVVFAGKTYFAHKLQNTTLSFMKSLIQKAIFTCVDLEYNNETSVIHSIQMYPCYNEERFMDKNILYVIKDDLNTNQVFSELIKFLGSTDIVKISWDYRQDARILKQHGIILQGASDLQLFFGVKKRRNLVLQ